MGTRQRMTQTSTTATLRQTRISLLRTQRVEPRVVKTNEEIVPTTPVMVMKTTTRATRAMAPKKRRHLARLKSSLSPRMRSRLIVTRTRAKLATRETNRCR